MQYIYARLHSQADMGSNEVRNDAQSEINLITQLFVCQYIYASVHAHPYRCEMSGLLYTRCCFIVKTLLFGYII